MDDDELATPPGWQSTTLGAIGRYLNGRAFKTSEWSKSGRPIIRIQDLTGSTKNPNYFEGDAEERHVVRRGDLLISWSATLGAYIWDGPEAVLNQHIFKVESAIDKRFHYHLVRERIGELQRQAHGSGMVHVTKAAFEETPVMVPVSRDVQKAVASFIDDADARQASAAQHVAAARDALNSFRQAVLVAAADGRLTAGWREGHTPSESATALLERIARERSEAHKSKLRTEPSDEVHGDIPDSWRWTSCEALCQADRALTYGVIKLGPPVDDGIPTLRSSDVRHLRIEEGHIKRISPAISSEYSRTVLRGGELVVTVRGSLGGVAVVPRHMAGFNVSREVAVVPLVQGISGQFYAYVIGNLRSQNWLTGVARGVAYTGINIADLKRLPVPVPPVEEQLEIVRRVEQLFALAEQVDGRITSADRQVKRAPQAVLAKAFRGDLGLNGGSDGT